MAKITAPNDEFDKLKLMFTDPEFGFLPSIKKNFTDLYMRAILLDANSNDQAESVYKDKDFNLSREDIQLLQNGLMDGIKRFTCIVVKYAKDLQYDNNTKKSGRESYIDDIQSKCENLQKDERYKKENDIDANNKRVIGKPFKYEEIKLFHPYQKMEDYEEIDITKHMKGKNMIAYVIDFYTKTLNKILESKNTFTQLDETVSKRLESYCAGRNITSVTSSLLRQANVNRQNVNPAAYKQIDTILGCAEAFIIKQFKRFADVTVQLDIECKIATYALIDAKYGNDATAKRPLVDAMTQISRNTANLARILQQVSKCYEVYMTSNSTESTEQLHKFMSQLESYSKPGLENGVSLMRGGGSFGSYTKSIAKAVIKFVYISIKSITLFLTGLTVIFVGTAFSAVCLLTLFPPLQILCIAGIIASSVMTGSSIILTSIESMKDIAPSKQEYVIDDTTIDTIIILASKNPKTAINILTQLSKNKSKMTQDYLVTIQTDLSGTDPTKQNTEQFYTMLKNSQEIDNSTKRKIAERTEILMKEKPTVGGGVQLRSMTKAQLSKLCKINNVSGRSTMSKDDMIASLKKIQRRLVRQVKK